MNPKKVSICIGAHNMAHLIGETIESCLMQDYQNIEIIVLDDASTDGTSQLEILNHPKIHIFRSSEPSGTGGVFNKAISYAQGDFIVLMCADDIFTDPRVISDIVKIFINNDKIAHVTRYYHQFIDGDRRPVRAWRINNIIELANNPSGLAFRKESLKDPSALGKYFQLSNKMFVEASTLVCQVMRNPNNFAMIMPWDTIAVRIHQSISRNKSYYRKRWVSSPVEEWTNVGGGSIQADFTSLVQIKNYFTTGAVIEECKNFIRLRPFNAFNPAFWFYAIVCVLTPRFILMKLPHLYRITFGRWTTKEIKRP